MEVGGLFVTKKYELVSYALHKGRNLESGWEEYLVRAF